MADLSNFLNGGDVIKSIQRGVTNVTSSGATATISAVDMGKSFVVMNWRSANSQSAIPTAELTSPTTVTFLSLDTSPASTSVWQVIEFK